MVVATATKALQDQLAEKDLPLVESGLGLPVPLDFAVLKGRSNYICRQRVAEVGSGGIQPELGDAADRAGADEREVERAEAEERGAPAPEGLVEEVRTLVAWSQTSADGRPGRPELRAVRPGLEHGQRRAPGVPGRVQLPLGRALLRRGGPRPGGRRPTSWW